MRRSAIASAVALHAAWVAVAVVFVHGATPLPPPPIDVDLAMLPPVEQSHAVPQALPAVAPGVPPTEAPAPEIAQAPPPPPLTAGLEVPQALPPQAPEDAPPSPIDPAPTEIASIVDPSPPPADTTAKPASLPRVPPPVRSSKSRPPTRSATAVTKDVAEPHESGEIQPQTVAASTPATSPVAPNTADREAALEARIRDAVQAAVRYPASARMMGVTGRARVLLDYRGGAVESPSLAQSSGAPQLDEAALAAVRAARYPRPPPEIEGRLLHLLIWVEFRAT